MSEEYTFWELAYRLGWATEEDLKKAVERQYITQEEMNKILGGTP